MTSLFAGSGATQTIGDTTLTDTIPGTLNVGSTDRFLPEDFSHSRRRDKIRTQINVEQPTIPDKLQNVRVDTFTVLGATPSEEARLGAFTKAYKGRFLSRQDYISLISEFNETQASAGSPYRVAYFPPQDFSGGPVTIAISSGRLADLKINGGDTVDRKRLEDLAREELSGLTNYNIANFATRAADIIGQPVSLNIIPAATASGDAQIIVTLGPPKVGMKIGVNNYGSYFFGRNIFTGEITRDSILQPNDELTIVGVSSINFTQLQLLRASYETPILTDGLTLSVTALRFVAKPGIDFLKDIDFRLQRFYMDAYLQQSIELDSEVEITLSGGLIRRNLKRNFVGAADANDILWAVDFGGELEIDKPRWGETSILVSARRTVDMLDATANDRPNSLRRGVGPGESALTVEVEHFWRVFPQIDATAALVRQLASGPLIGPDQCEYGGGPFGHGYDAAELGGDACFLVSLKMELAPGIIQLGDVSVAPFISADHGMVRLKGAVDTSAPVIQAQQITHQSIGAGVELEWRDNLTAEFAIGVPFQESTLPGIDKSVRFIFALKATY